MAVLVSEGQLLSTARPPARQSTATTLYGLRVSYAEIFRSQSAVRTVVGAIAKNAAQIGTHVYRSLDDGDDRQRDRTSPLAATIRRPNPTLTRYSWIFGMVADLCIFDAHTAVKVKGDAGRISIWPIPAELVEPVGKSWIAPEGFRIGGARGVVLSPDQVIHIHGYSPVSRLGGTPPMEAIRRILGGDQAAEDHRETFWRNGAQLSGVLRRPVEAPAWSPDAKKNFAEQWRSRYSGDGSTPGGTPLLEDGMEYTPLGQHSRNNQYIEGRKLTREEVAALYCLPLVYAGILEGANYAVVKEARQMLYQDTLGPLIVSLQEELDAQLVSEWDPTGETYVEFNWLAKLAGSFEEQASVLSTATGRPWLTTAEARSRLNLRRLDDPTADELIVPLNVSVGGQASPQTPVDVPKAIGAKATVSTIDVAPSREVKAFARAVDRQASELSNSGKALSDLPSGWSARWDTELAADLLAEALVIAEDQAGKVAAAADVASGGAEPMRGWLAVKTRAEAEAFNSITRTALRSTEPGPVFAAAKERAATSGKSVANGVAQFAAVDTAQAVGLTGGTKTWRVTAANSRHPNLNGQTVPLGSAFSNKARWPADANAGPDESAGCTCQLTLKLERAT